MALNTQDYYDGSGEDTDDVKLDKLTCITSDFQPEPMADDERLNELTLIHPEFVPVSAIANPDDQADGVFMNASQLFRMQLVKAEHVRAENRANGNIGYTVEWDEEPASLIPTLERCGPAPTIFDDRMAAVTPRPKFDPRQPHFDVVIINLLDSPYFPQGDAVPESGLPRTPMDDLPVESLLGRPGFVFVHVGGTAIGKLEGIRLFEAWGIKLLETITWIPTDLDLIHPNQSGIGILRLSTETWLVGMRGSATRLTDDHIIHCNARGDLVITGGRPQVEGHAETFVNGQRRLALFAIPGGEREGWVRMGKNLPTTFICREWMKKWEARDSWLLERSLEVDYFRPKEPPHDDDQRVNRGRAFSATTALDLRQTGATRRFSASTFNPSSANFVPGANCHAVGEGAVEDVRVVSLPLETDALAGPDGLGSDASISVESIPAPRYGTAEVPYFGPASSRDSGSSVRGTVVRSGVAWAAAMSHRLQVMVEDASDEDTTTSRLGDMVTGDPPPPTPSRRSGNSTAETPRRDKVSRSSSAGGAPTSSSVARGSFSPKSSGRSFSIANITSQLASGSFSLSSPASSQPGSGSNNTKSSSKFASGSFSGHSFSRSSSSNQLASGSFNSSFSGSSQLNATSPVFDEEMDI